jgi:hypothetical protein
MRRLKPAGWAAHVNAVPLLMIVGAADECTFADLQLEV